MSDEVIAAMQEANRYFVLIDELLVAAGKKAGGYDTIFEAAQQMASLQDVVYTPTPAHKAIYDQIYAEYVKLHDHFGRGENDVMKRLKTLKQRVLAGS